MSDLGLGHEVIGAAVAAVGGAVVGRLTFVGKVRDLKNAVDALKAQFEAVRSGVKLEVDTHKTSVEEKLDKMEKDVEEIKDLVNDWRESKADFAKDAELAQFMMEVNNRWTEVTSLIGEIRGELRARRQLAPDSNPPRK